MMNLPIGCEENLDVIDRKKIGRDPSKELLISPALFGVDNGKSVLR